MLVGRRCRAVCVCCSVIDLRSAFSLCRQVMQRLTEVTELLAMEEMTGGVLSTVTVLAVEVA